MLEMNSYYAHCSPVGEVFDVATFSPRKAVTTIVFGFLLGPVFAIAAVHLYNPALLPISEAQWIAEFNEAIVEGGKTHPLAMNLGIGFLGVLAFIILTVSLANVVDSNDKDFYLRAGPGGFSVRVRNGVALTKLRFKILQLDLPWEEIEKWTLVQETQIGTLHERNVSTYVKLKTIGGKKYAFYLDCFKESGESIWRKLQDAMNMVSAQLDADPTSSEHSSQSLQASTPLEL